MLRSLKTSKRGLGAYAVVKGTLSTYASVNLANFERDGGQI